MFELLDVILFGYPSLPNLDPELTAINILERFSGRSFMSYGSPIALMPQIVRGVISDAEIKRKLNFYSDEWKNTNLQEVARLLREKFGGIGSWYNVPLRPVQVFDGVWFKPSIKGVWFDRGQAHMVGINPRKRLALTTEHVSFLGRGMHELYGVDDPNDPIALSIDLSVPPESDQRERRSHLIAESQMITLAEFEDIMRRFFEALRIAGIESVPRRIDDVTDLFRKHR